MAEIQIIQGDCFEIMPKLKRQFDMIFVDPPYFDWDIPHGQAPDHNKLSALCSKLLKKTGILWLCGTQPNLAKNWKYWERFFNFNFELIVYKTSGTPPVSKRRPIQIHENIWCLFKKGVPLPDLDIDMRRLAKYPTSDKKLKALIMKIRSKDERISFKQGVGYPRSVIRAPKIDSKSKEYWGHPCQKPEKVLEFVIKCSTREGDWILDPFAGVGTTGVVADRMNRNAILIEINPEYVKQAERRLECERKVRRLEKFML